MSAAINPEDRFSLDVAQLASEAEQTDLGLTWSKALKTGFLMTQLTCVCLVIQA